MAQPQPPPHFWQRGQSCYGAINNILAQGPSCKQEDVVQGAWEALVRKYFPEFESFPGGPHYWIRVQPYRARLPDPPSTHKPDVIVVKFSTPQLGPNNIWWDLKRDVLWVECKASCYDTPGQWKRVIEEATERLKNAHPDRNVWLIVAIGLRWMVFYWDPMNSRTNTMPMAVMRDDRTGAWSIDADIRVPPPPPQPNTNQAPVINIGRYFHPSTGVINTDGACSLDYWTPDPLQPGQPKEMNSLLLLEDVFRAIQADVYAVPSNSADLS